MEPLRGGRLNLAYTVSNTGNTRLSIAPRITATALFGLVSFEVKGDEVAEIAPGETRSATIVVPSVWPLFAYTAAVTATPTTVGADAPEMPAATASASATIVAMPWPQAVVIVLAALVVWWLRRDRRRREAQVAARVEQARQEGRREVAERQVRHERFAAGAVAVVLAVAFTLGDGQAAGAATSATPPATDSGTVSVRVEIAGSVPGPDGPSGGQVLPTTGADARPLVLGSALALALGAALLGSARRALSTAGRDGDRRAESRALGRRTDRRGAGG